MSSTIDFAAAALTIHVATADEYHLALGRLRALACAADGSAKWMERIALERGIALFAYGDGSQQGPARMRAASRRRRAQTGGIAR